MRVTKGVRFGYSQTELTDRLLRTFRQMVNDAIHICIEENIAGRLNLRNRIYKEFQDKYGVTSRFPYSVAEVAWSIVKRHRRWQRKPIAKRLTMKMDSQSYTLNHGLLSLPFKSHHRIFIPLEYGNYEREFLLDTDLKKGSVTLTESSVIISFSKEIFPIVPTGKIGLDLNEKSVPGSDGTKYDLSSVARTHTEYGIRRSKFYRKHPNDQRLKKKYSGTRKEREKIKQLLHRVAKQIVASARLQRKAIILEKLKGIRLVHQKGNGEGTDRRRRISQWPFRQFQDYVEYKASWAGIPVEYVSPAFTSQICSKCLHTNKALKLMEREWRCPNCGAILDRDLNAAANIERRGR